MEQQTYLTLIGKYLSGNISEREAARLMEWVDRADANRLFFEEMEQLWGITNEYEAPTVDTNTPAAWEALDAKLDSLDTESQHSGQQDARVRRLSFTPRLILRYAAAILVLLAAGYWSYEYIGGNAKPAEQIVAISTTDGEERSILLPDSSVVVLNERSTLSYASLFHERKVELAGEAFFEITHKDGKTFTIKAEGTTTTVLGTSFNVRAYPEESRVEVSVASGKVAVSKQGEKPEKVELIAGQASVYDKQQDDLDKTVLLNANAWKTNRLDFENIKLGVVAENLERYFNISITFEDEKLKECRYMGSFPNPGIEEVFRAMEFTMNLEVVEKQGSYLIKGDASQCQ
jgi:ferric-dicitrate binding protein FerR (iron transport regulator)